LENSATYNYKTLEMILLEAKIVIIVDFPD